MKFRRDPMNVMDYVTNDTFVNNMTEQKRNIITITT